MQCQLLTVKVHLIFGLIILTADVHFTHTFHLQQFLFQFGWHFVRSGEVVTINLKVGTCLSRHTCITTSQNNLCLAELRITFQVLTHLVTDCFQWDITISRVYQTDVEGNNVRAVVLHGSPCIVRVGLSHCIVTYFHNALILGHPLVGQLLRKFLCYLFSRTDRQLQLHCNTGVILRWKELCTNTFGTQQADSEESDTSQNDYPTMTHCPVQHLRIPGVESVQCFFNRGKE